MYAVHHYLHFFQIVVIGKRLIGLWSIGRYCYYLWFSWKNRVEPIQRAPLCTDGCRMGTLCKQIQVTIMFKIIS